MVMRGYYNPKTGNYEMPPPKTTMEKNIPSDFFGEWCYVGDNGNGGINYRLPSWSEPGLCDRKDKLLNISAQTFGADEIYCDLTSKVKVTEECVIWLWDHSEVQSQRKIDLQNRNWSLQR